MMMWQNRAPTLLQNMAAAVDSSKELSFATDLWDGFSPVCSHSKRALSAMKDVHNFFKERAQLEEVSIATRAPRARGLCSR